ncbi:hypothetical protein [Desulfacinum infernum]|uniref:hypothetical protein n=1 Tax=Desulfacinum infernum TaxID=35837 RepID=UPI0015B4AA2E|nr:hypothetical protein [Desulfacinum infernum]
MGSLALLPAKRRVGFTDRPDDQREPRHLAWMKEQVIAFISIGVDCRSLAVLLKPEKP